jgi:hypothetical protein
MPYHLRIASLLFAILIEDMGRPLLHGQTLAEPPLSRFALANPSESTPPIVTAVGNANVGGANVSREIIDPNQLVFFAIKTAIAGPPIACKVHQQTTAYKQQTIMSGEYKSLGNWTGQFRYVARMSAGETTLDTVQISDGRLMYTQFGTKSMPKLVNVEKIREQLTPRLYRPEENPDVYISLAIGGQAEVLRCLYQRYNWYRVVEGKVAGVDVWQLFGKLRTDPAKHAGTAKIDKSLLSLNPETQNLPSNVRLTLGRPTSAQLQANDTFPYFPYLIEYFRLEKNDQGRVTRLAPLSKIEYLEPKYNFPISESDFVYRVEASTERIDEETSQYMPEK